MKEITTPALEFETPDGRRLRLFALNLGEYLDPKTSSHGRHSMHGPAVVLQWQDAGLSTTEYHPGDAHAWDVVRDWIELHAEGAARLIRPLVPTDREVLENWRRQQTELVRDCTTCPDCEEPC